MEKVEFGVAETTANLTIGSNGADAVGLVGVGFEANEAGISALNQPPYPNIVCSLRNNGVIGTRAFSLYVNSQGSYIQVPLESIVGDLIDNPPRRRHWQHSLWWCRLFTLHWAPCRGANDQ